MGKRKNRRFNPRFLVTLGVVAVLLAALVVLVVFIVRGRQSSQQPGLTLPAVETVEPATQAPAATVPAYDGPPMLAHMMQRYLVNPDTVAWIGLPDRSLDRSVALAGKNTRQLPELAPGCSLEPESTNLVIIDNNINLRSLVQYRDAAFLEKYPQIFMSTRFEDREYQVMAAFFEELQGGEFDLTQFAEPESETQFAEVMAYIADKALYETGVTASFGERLLVVVVENKSLQERFVLVAKYIEE